MELEVWVVTYTHSVDGFGEQAAYDKEEVDSVFSTKEGADAYARHRGYRYNVHGPYPVE